VVIAAEIREPKGSICFVKRIFCPTLTRAHKSDKFTLVKFKYRYQGIDHKVWDFWPTILLVESSVHTLIV